MRTRPLLLAITLLAFVGIARHATGAPPIEVGQPFPDLVLPSLENGEPMSISDFRGRKVVLHVFASW
ncbi:MAG: TlpA family protein disulfide reductase [Planctomycetota bacterium]|jgi:hypothetical protein